MTTFVLVPGMCHGGWWYEPLAAALGEHGHTGIAVTPSALGPDGMTGPVNLDTHVQDVIDACPAAAGLVLVGHSYGGALISCAADHLGADRVSGLVYLDAFMPADGDSCFSMTSDTERAWYVEGAGTTGHVVDPLPFFDDRARPHPVATLVQTIHLSGAWEQVPVKHYVEATDTPADASMGPTIARVKQRDDVVFHSWDTRHNVMHDGPGRVLELLLTVAGTL